MKEMINKFYTSFSELDHENMVSCYHSDIIFEDPVFGVLVGERAKNMWRMLCESQKGKEFKLEFYNVSGNYDKGEATWEAHYFYGKSNRKVHNIIKANFEFKDGLIIKHTDHFNLRRWSMQALGIKAKILAGTYYFKRKLRAKSLHLLKTYEEKKLSKIRA